MVSNMDMDVSPGSVGKTTVTAGFPFALVTVPDPAEVLEPGPADVLDPVPGCGITAYPDSIATAVSSLLDDERQP